MARRPASTYSDMLARRICDLIAEGSSLETIGELPDMPSRRTMRGWLEDHPDFLTRYEIARRERTDNLVDEAIAIADSVRGTDSNAAVGAAKLAVDTRRWLASKLLPERFGDQLAITGKGGDPLLTVDPPDSSKIALVILSLLHAALRDAEPQPAIEHEAAEAAPVKHLEVEPAASPRYEVPARTLLSVRQDDAELQRQQAIAREYTRLKVVQLYGRGR
jgi:hypothetical protein